MAHSGEIKSDKVLVKGIFEQMWFCVPEYQRPYVWGSDEVDELLDDLHYALSARPDSEYFLGSFVFQARPADPEKGQEFDEKDLLDGQQRMTTLLMLLAVIRDLSEDPLAKTDCQNAIYQQASVYKNVPERTRLVYKIRDNAQRFVDDYLKTGNGTNNEETFEEMRKKERDVSLRNMANAVLDIRRFFSEEAAVSPEDFLKFLMNNVLLIYVSTEDLEDAFRLFTILNDRGIPLRNSDILKTKNLEALSTEEEKIKYAKFWETAEGELGDEFDRFLNHVRTIIVKDRPRSSLLQEFENRIYNPRDYDKKTKQWSTKSPLLSRGRETFELVERYFNHYQLLLGGNNHDAFDSFKYDNLIRVMLEGLPATDWVPPLLSYYDKFEYEKVLDFLILLDNKFSADWVGQYTPTVRVESMNRVIDTIDSAGSTGDVLGSDCFDANAESFLRVLDGPIYGKKFAKYLLLKLDFFFQTHDHRMSFEKLSIEHILPQNPEDTSRWVRDFTQEEREFWTDRLGNLVLITGRKNTAQGRLDYLKKRDKYFKTNIDTCPNSLRVLRKYDSWVPQEVEENQKFVVSKLSEHYGPAFLPTG